MGIRYRVPGELTSFRLGRVARTVSRFAKHFDKDGNPSETLLRAKQERPDNWHTVQELAGII
jgi:hypothetical protein